MGQEYFTDGEKEKILSSLNEGLMKIQTNFAKRIGKMVQKRCKMMGNRVARHLGCIRNFEHEVLEFRERVARTNISELSDVPIMYPFGGPISVISERGLVVCLTAGIHMSSVGWFEDCFGKNGDTGDEFEVYSEKMLKRVAEWKVEIDNFLTLVDPSGEYVIKALSIHNRINNIISK